MKSLLGKLGIVLFGLTIFFYTEVWGADWKFALKNDFGEYFYDAENIAHPRENIFGIWEKIVYSDKSIDEMAARLGEEYRDLRETLIYWEINCADKKCCLLHLYDCSKSGNVICSLPNLKREWKLINSKTVTAIFYKVICK